MVDTTAGFHSATAAANVVVGAVASAAITVAS